MTRIKDVMAHAWAESTRESYGSGLLVFHIFCDAKSIPDSDRAPASTQLIALFISSLAGQYSGGTVANYLQGIRTWHIMHCLIWSHNDTEIEALLKAAVTLAPTSSKRKPHEPYTVNVLNLMRDNLNLTDPAEAAVFACLTTTFWCMACIREFTVPRLDTFDPLLHVKPSNVMHQKDRQGLMVTNFHLPRTKSALLGKDVSWAQQLGPSDPQAAFQNHIAVNSPPVDGHLFAYRHKGGHRPSPSQNSPPPCPLLLRKQASSPSKGTVFVSAPPSNICFATSLSMSSRLKAGGPATLSLSTYAIMPRSWHRIYKHPLLSMRVSSGTLCPPYATN
ncbi:hypothetical protein PAXRUDRAFT_19696 [Paxillus rubicundulus Ve08.2h10]|uniref:Unplaced genomic scaffold scaffold_3880, whole genome shotgun sequence n=1 Tax=Paxillus rubicundulus Ve08.2h10 TaxID=930991 RepID=A0A0D0BT52_9AGAM|nr:hypothetical protein PAXRUDRAFT_19696 [Paxillus rubicundulus Ve08.2h10]